MSNMLFKLALHSVTVTVISTGFLLLVSASLPLYETEEEFIQYCEKKHWYPIKKWPRNTIPYKMPEHWDQNQRDEVLDAMKEIEEQTKFCVTFIPHGPHHQKHKGFIDIHDDQKHSSSPVGFQGGAGKSQKLTINSLITKSRRHEVILHELLHALGLIHEFARPDRDKYVDVLWENLPSADLYCKHPETTYDPSIPFDPYSVMQYNPGNKGEYFQLKSDQNMKIRPDGHLTRLDALKIIRMYNCAEPRFEIKVDEEQDSKSSAPPVKGLLSKAYRTVKDYAKHKIVNVRGRWFGKG